MLYIRIVNTPSKEVFFRNPLQNYTIKLLKPVSISRKMHFFCGKVHFFV